MSNERDELIRIIWDEAVADRVKGGESPQHVPIVRPKVEAMADRILAAGYSKPRMVAAAEELDPLPLEYVRDETAWNYTQSDDPLLTCPVCRAAVAWSDKDDHLGWHSITQPNTKAQALDKAADDAEGLGMAEIPVHSLRFRAECYRNMGANLYGGQG